MKNILSLLGTITLIGTSTTSLVACNKPQYSEDDLKKEKEKNNININGNILEGIAQQERPFNQVDNKGYFVVWRGDENSDGRISKFKNDKSPLINIDSFNNRGVLTYDIGFASKDMDLFIENQTGIVKDMVNGRKDKGNYFKSVYRGNSDNEPNIPEIDNNGNIKN